MTTRDQTVKAIIDGITLAMSRLSKIEEDAVDESAWYELSEARRLLATKYQPNGGAR